MKFSHLCLHNFVFELDLDFILVLIIPLSTFQLSVMAAPMETEPVDTSSCPSLTSWCLYLSLPLQYLAHYKLCQEAD